MSVSAEEVRRVAHLARIKIEDEKIDEIRSSMNGILSFVEQLREVDCSKIDDSIQYVTSLHERDDVVEPCDPSVMENASKKECNMFVVPKVVS